MIEPAWSWILHQQIPSSVDAGHAVIEKLLVALHESNWDGRDLFHVQMAAEEAMVNAVKHGNCEVIDKLVEIELKVRPDTTYMRFRDQGNGFCPDDLPDPRDDEYLQCTNGRGVMLIKEMMSEVRFNEQGNEIIMIKHRSRESDL